MTCIPLRLALPLVAMRYLSPTNGRPTASDLGRGVDGKAARRSRELGVALSVGRPLVRVRGVVTIPGDRNELLVGPFGLDRGAGPLISQIVQHVDQARLIDAVILEADALHDVEIGVGVEDLRVATGVLAVRV